MSLDLHKDFGPEPQVSSKHNSKAIQWKPVSPQPLQCGARRTRTRTALPGTAICIHLPFLLFLSMPAGSRRSESHNHYPSLETALSSFPKTTNKMLRQQAPHTGKLHPAARGASRGCCVSAGAWQKWGGLKFLPDWNLKCPEGSNSGPTTKDLPFLSFANRHHHGRFGALRRRQSDPNVAPLHSPVGGQLCCCSQGYRWSSSDQELPSAHKSTVSASYARAHSAASARCSPQTTVLTNAARNSLGN